MVVLVLIVAELLFPVIGAMVAVSVALAMAVFDLIGLLISALFGVALSRRSARHDAAPEASVAQAVPTPAKGAPTSRRRHLLLIPFAVVAVASVLVNFIFFEPTTRWAVEKFAAKAGFAVSFETVEGSLYSGRFSFQNLAVVREPSQRAGFDLHIEQAALDVNLWSLIFRPIRLESLAIVSVTGKITKPAKSAQPEDGAEDGSGKLKPKRRFIVDRLEIQDVRLTILGPDGTDSDIEIVNALSQPLRSDLAVFDFFFRSTVDARVDGHPISISTEELEAGRRTYWDIRDFPVSSAAGLVPKPPITWFESGSISARVEDRWSLSEDDTSIDMDWSITMRGVSVVVPQDAGPMEKITAFALAKAVNGRADDVTFEFSLVLDRENFRNAVSLDAAGFWKSLVAGLVKASVARHGGDAAESEDRIQDRMLRLKSFLGRRNTEAE